MNQVAAVVLILWVAAQTINALAFNGTSILIAQEGSKKEAVKDDIPPFEDEEQDKGGDFEDEEGEEGEEDEEDIEVSEDLEEDKVPAEILKSIKEVVKGKDLKISRETLYHVSTVENGKNIFYLFNFQGRLMEKEVEGSEEADERENDGSDNGESVDNEDTPIVP